MSSIRILPFQFELDAADSSPEALDFKSRYRIVGIRWTARLQADGTEARNAHVAGVTRGDEYPLIIGNATYDGGGGDGPVGDGRFLELPGDGWMAGTNDPWTATLVNNEVGAVTFNLILLAVPLGC